jgi:type II secretory pathway component PulC
MTIIQLPKSVFIFLCAFFTLGVLATFMGEIRQWSKDWQLAHQALRPSTQAKINVEEMISAIPKAHLFGQALSSLNEVPISGLELQVRGIVKVDNEQEKSASKAYISMRGEASKIYQTGDSLPGGVKVYAIRADSVILEKAGQLQQLPLTRKKLEFKKHNKSILEDR